MPIRRDDKQTVLLTAARTCLKSELTQQGIRAHVDQRTGLSAGFKFNDWELRGAPLRVELGPRDLDAGTVLMARRLNYDRPGDSGERTAKESVSLDSAVARLSFELAAVQEMLLRRATDFRDERTVRTDTWADFTAAVAVGWALALHCGDQACEDEIKAETTATARCIPLDGEPESGPCVRCGRPSAYGKRVYFGRSYQAQLNSGPAKWRGNGR